MHGGSDFTCGTTLGAQKPLTQSDVTCKVDVGGDWTDCEMEVHLQQYLGGAGEEGGKLGVFV